eukprot:gene52770-70543_t
MKISARDIDHLSLTVSDPAETAARLNQLGFNLTPDDVEPRCICFQPDRDDVPNYVELLQGHPPLISLALNVPELEGEERTHSWETEDGFEVDAGVVVGESSGPLPWFPVKHETPDAFMEPEWIVHPNGALGMMANWDLPQLASDLPRLTAPLSLIVGSQDHTVQPRQAEQLVALWPARSACARPQLINLPGLGHLAHEEQPELSGIRKQLHNYGQPCSASGLNGVNHKRQFAA